MQPPLPLTPKQILLKTCFKTCLPNSITQTTLCHIFVLSFGHTLTLCTKNLWMTCLWYINGTHLNLTKTKSLISFVSHVTFLIYPHTQVIWQSLISNIIWFQVLNEGTELFKVLCTWQEIKLCAWLMIIGFRINKTSSF